MASADCVNNVGMLPEGFLDCSSYGWYSDYSPRISFSRDFVEEESKKASSSSSKQKMVIKEDEGEDLKVVVVGSVKNELNQKVGSDFGFGDFEFRLEEDPVRMLAADELFSDGKLVPRQLNTMRIPVIAESSTVSSEEEEEIINLVPETAKAFRRMDVSDAELYLFSPKAPRCSSRWKELLGLKRNNNQTPKTHDENQNQKISSSSLKNGALKHFLQRNNPKSLSQSLDSSLNLPLLGDSDFHLPNSLSSSSSSSASSSSNHDEHPRFSLDSNPKHKTQISLNRNPPRVRLSSKSRPPTASSSSETIQQHHTSARARRNSMHRVSSSDQSSNQSIIGLTIDSPRMSSSGKIVFQSLERSSSSPSTFNGGPRVKHRGVERCYSANVRVTPVLNVPVCSLRGSSKSGGGGGSVFGFFSTNTSTNANVQKRGDNNGSTSIRNHHHHTNKNRATNSTTDRN